jgi:hypothetical protein
MTVRRYLRQPRKRDVGEFVGGTSADKAFHRPWSTPPDTPEGGSIQRGLGSLCDAGEQIGVLWT